MRVLIVEDDPAQRRLLSLIVRTHGHLPVECATVAEARGAKACPVSFVDRELPDGDGLDLARDLRGKVYLLTGDEYLAPEPGYTILLKPVRPRQLEALLDPSGS